MIREKSGGASVLSPRRGGCAMKNRNVTEKLDLPLVEKWALGYLGRYSSSAENLRRVLRRRARRLLGTDRDRLRAADATIDGLILRYRESGLIDDMAYAASRARSRLARGRPLRRVVADLIEKGIAGNAAEAAIAALREEGAEPDLAAACAFARRRRLGPFAASSDAHDRGRALGAFARAGFARRDAEAVLACADPEAVAALLAGSE